MKKVYISQLANPLLFNYLESKGYNPEIIYKNNRVYDAVSSHPDMFFCKMGIKDNSLVFKGNPDNIGFQYPKDILYNAACTGKFFIHNLKHTAPALLSIAKSMNMKLVNVK